MDAVTLIRSFLFGGCVVMGYCAMKNLNCIGELRGRCYKLREENEALRKLWDGKPLERDVDYQLRHNEIMKRSISGDAMKQDAKSAAL